MLSLSPAKLLIVLVVAMILLGPDKLPQVARQMGAAWRTFRSFHQRVEEEVRGTIPDLPSGQDLARLARSPVQFLNQLADLSPTDLAPAVPDPGDAPAPDGGATVWPADPSDIGAASPPAVGDHYVPARADREDRADQPAPATPAGASGGLPGNDLASMPDDPSMN